VGCFVAILHTNDAPVDERRLRTMLDIAPFDAAKARVTVSDSVGFAYAPLRTPHLVERIQPVEHGALRIVMDGRLDDRAAFQGASDADLVLAAYERWGTGCAAHLLGDFSFCIWDSERRQLVCARDHFGVKPLYYARVGGAVVISNVLRSVRRYPDISDRLDDQAVGDVLLFGLAMDSSRTMFADVSRVPPGHMLTCSGSSVRVHRYWAMDPPETRNDRNHRDAVEDFAATFRLAVADRVRTGPIGVFMSGGLDSTSVAAVAADVLGPSAPQALRAFTGVYETVAADEERHYSSLVATWLNIGIDHLPLDGYALFDRWDAGELPPEPTTEPMTATTADLLTRAADHGGAVLTGDGGDPLLLPTPLVSQIGRVPFSRLMAGFWISLRAQERPPIGVRSSLRRQQRGAGDVPAWLAESLLHAFDARARWVEINARRTADRGPRSTAVNSIVDAWWPSTFETYDPGATGRPVEMRYPFFDVRLVSVGLALPSFPFCVNKHVLRSAMRGRLPDAIVQRPKTPLAVLPEAFHGRWSLSAAVQALAAVPAIEQYVDIRKFADVRPEFLFTDRARGTLAAVSLALWLRHSAAAVPST
jgi:asparagine synthase (glutamine-hydrolysing)